MLIKTLQGGSGSPGGQGRQRGFTVIELMVTVAVIAIVSLVAAPNFRGMINGNRLSAVTNDYLALSQAAKMEAIRRGTRVTMCPSDNGTSCNGSDWRRVIIITADNTVLREVISDTGVVVRPSASISGANPAHRIVYRPDGLARPGNATAILTGKLEICINTTRPAQNARRLSISGARASVDAHLTSAACNVTVPNT